MNREIKFRGKRIDNGQWVYGGITRPFNGDSVAIIETGSGEHYFHQVSPKTVGQYTGLKDKNGVDVFEEDVVKVYRAATGTLWREGTVVWRNYQFGVDTETKNVYGIMPLPASYRIEVIGNIYENPELLETV